MQGKSLVNLSDCILGEMDAIVAEWEAYAAAQLPAAAQMGPPALRDHAELILRAIAKDIQTAQSDEERAQKSKGRAPRPSDTGNTVAEMHALHRVQSGFDINQMAGEYRALRASVLRLWARSFGADPVDPHPGIQLIAFMA